MSIGTSQHRLLLGLETGIPTTSGDIVNFEKIAIIILSALVRALIFATLRCALRFGHRFLSSANDFDITFRVDGVGNGNYVKNIVTDVNIRSLASRIPETVYRSSEEGIPECPICLAGFERGERVRVIPGCNHGFHEACIDAWFGSHSSCPVCRQRLASY